MKKFTRIMGLRSLEPMPPRKDEEGYQHLTQEEKLAYFDSYAKWRERVFISVWIEGHLKVDEIKERAKWLGIISELEAIKESIKSVHVKL